MLQRVISRISVDFSCLTVPKKMVGETFCAVFQKNSGSEKFMDKRGGEFSRLSIENFLSHSAKNFRRGGGNSLVFQ